MRKIHRSDKHIRTGQAGKMGRGETGEKRDDEGDDEEDDSVYKKGNGKGKAGNGCRIVYNSLSRHSRHSLTDFPSSHRTDKKRFLFYFIFSPYIITVYPCYVFCLSSGLWFCK